MFDLGLWFRAILRIFRTHRNVLTGRRIANLSAQGRAAYMKCGVAVATCPESRPAAKPTQAAEILGISRATIYQLLARAKTPSASSRLRQGDK